MPVRTTSIPEQAIQIIQAAHKDHSTVFDKILPKATMEPVAHMSAA
jgi:hypothetical protein